MKAYVAAFILLAAAGWAAIAINQGQSKFLFTEDLPAGEGWEFVSAEKFNSLRKGGFNPTVFVPTNFVPTKRYATRAQADSGGGYTWTFPTPFDAGVIPVVQITVEDNTPGHHRITALSNTSVTVAVNSSAFVHLTAEGP
jgi:hypothetical protein